MGRKEFDRKVALEERPWRSGDHLNGIIIPGRRLGNCRIKLFAESNWRDIHGELGGDGRCTILMFGTDDFGHAEGVSISTRVATKLCNQVVNSSNSKLSPGL